MEDFVLLNRKGKELRVAPTIDGHICIMIDEKPSSSEFSWRHIWLTEDEAKAVRRALTTAIANNKLRKDEE